MTDSALADRYRAYLELCNRGDFGGFDQLVADEVRVSGTVLTRAAYADAIGAVREAFPDYRWEIRELVVDPPLLAVRLVGTGTHTGGPWLDRPAAGARVTIPEQAFYTFAEDRIREVWSVTDRLDALRQLGGSPA